MGPAQRPEPAASAMDRFDASPEDLSPAREMEAGELAGGVNRPQRIRPLGAGVASTRHRADGFTESKESDMLKTIAICAIPIVMALYVANLAAQKLNDVANKVAAAQFERGH